MIPRTSFVGPGGALAPLRSARSKQPRRAPSTRSTLLLIVVGVEPLHRGASVGVLVMVGIRATKEVLGATKYKESTKSC